jgi:serine/threonine protein kinase
MILDIYKITNDLNIFPKLYEHYIRNNNVFFIIENFGQKNIPSTPFNLDTFIKNAIKKIHTIHSLNITHGDLNTRNIMIIYNDIYFIDVDSCKKIDDKVPLTMTPLDDKVPLTMTPLDDKVPLTMTPLDDKVPLTMTSLDDKVPLTMNIIKDLVLLLQSIISKLLYKLLLKRNEIDNFVKKIEILYITYIKDTYPKNIYDQFIKL